MLTPHKWTYSRMHKLTQDAGTGTQNVQARVALCVYQSKASASANGQPVEAHRKSADNEIIDRHIAWDNKFSSKHMARAPNINLSQMNYFLYSWPFPVTKDGIHRFTLMTSYALPQCQSHETRGKTHRFISVLYWMTVTMVGTLCRFSDPPSDSAAAPPSEVCCARDLALGEVTGEKEGVSVEKQWQSWVS